MMQKEYPFLADKEKCTGCGTCSEVCSKKCISLVKDDLGFSYPVIDRTKCINCGNCSKHCPELKTTIRKKSYKAFSGKAKNKSVLLNAASGGAFSCIAFNILSENGIVYGCFSDQKNQWKTSIIRVSAYDDLEKLQGSKYYESDSRESYAQVKKDLEKGNTVLYGARPCQIAALYSYLGSCDATNLITVDVVCHGITSLDLFREYLNVYEKRYNCLVKDYRFRSHKSNKGGGYFGCVSIVKNGRTLSKPLLWQCDSLYYHYMIGNIYRESCFNCQYSNRDRVGDITLGDFWGVERIVPGEHVGNVSLVLINSNKGEKLLSSVKGLDMKEVDFSEAMNSNGSLNHPTVKPIESRTELIEIYKQLGWNGVESAFKKINLKEKALALITYYMPDSIKNLKKIIR